MTLPILITPEAEARLRQRAADAGVPPAELASRIVEIQLRRPMLDEISGPIYQRFLASGTTENELFE